MIARTSGSGTAGKLSSLGSESGSNALCWGLQGSSRAPQGHRCWLQQLQSKYVCTAEHSACRGSPLPHRRPPHLKVCYTPNHRAFWVCHHAASTENSSLMVLHCHVEQHENTCVVASILYQYVQQPGGTSLSTRILCLQPLPQVGYNELKYHQSVISPRQQYACVNHPAIVGEYIDPEHPALLG